MSNERPSTGPVDFIAIDFPGSQFKGEILPAIQELVDAGTIAVIDILLAVREGEGDVRVLELQEVPDELFARLDPVVSEISGLLTENDIRQLSMAMAPDSSMALLLFENTWARKVGDAIEAADGRVMMFERIPRPVVQDLIEERERLLAGAESA
jgi:hypothetical protein